MIVRDGLFVLPTDDIARSQGCYLDFTLPDKIIRFAEEFCTIQTDDYSGRAGRKVTLLDWQRAAIRTGFGWRNKHGDLRFTNFSWWMGRRQGKSLLCSILATYFMLSSARSKVPLIASSMEEARAVFDRCEDFVNAHPKLKDRCDCARSHLTITDNERHGEIKVLSSEKCGKLGKGVQLLIEDEIAAWPKHSARDVVNALHDSLKDKVNAVTVSISTPQHDLSSLGREKFLQAEKVLKGESDDITLFPVIFQAPENFRDDIEGALRAALPALNITTPLHKYLEEWKAVEGTIDEPRFLVMNLGLWVSSPEVWIPFTFWEACRAPFDERQFYGRQFDEIAVGCDWGPASDWTAYTIIVRKGELHYLIPRFFIPAKRVAEYQHKQNVPVESWMKEPANNIIVTDGDVVDGGKVIQTLLDDRAKFGFHEVRFDPSKMALMDTMLQAKGFMCKSVSTGTVTMSAAFEKFETLIKSRNVRHTGGKVSDWMFGNCKPKAVNDKTMVVKSGDMNKIDFVDSVAIGMTHWLDRTNQTPVCPQGQSWVISM